MSAKLHRLPASMTMTVEQALDSAKQIGLKQVIVLGYDENDALVVRASRMTRAEAFWVLEAAKDWVKGGE